MRLNELFAVVSDFGLKFTIFFNRSPRDTLPSKTCFDFALHFSAVFVTLLGANREFYLA
jgi:hypothetical protein